MIHKLIQDLCDDTNENARLRTTYVIILARAFSISLIYVVALIHNLDCTTRSDVN